MSDTIVWNKNFETDIKSIDEQHHHLVDLINTFSDLVTNQEVHEVDVVMLFTELNEYTHYHFKEEEKLMKEAGLHPNYIESHEAIHEGFIRQLSLMKNTMQLGSRDDWLILLDFLYQWLGHHILGQDQSIARQISIIKKGQSPESAMEQEKAKLAKDNIDPLLQSLRSMLELLAKQNVEMKDLNAQLEVRVKERTRELEEAYKKLEVISLTDALTGLPNRRYALMMLKDFWEESGVSGKALSCMMVDADYFKEVNDNWGHDEGDKVLCELARTLKNNARNDDYVCRLGGDEFFIICPNTNLEGCQLLANQLLEKVKTLKVSVGNSHWRSSISIGVAYKSLEMESLEELIKVSDESVYLAKQAGKGCVRAKQAL